MVVLGKETVVYAYPYHSWEQDEDGFYFPDAIIQPFIEEAKPLTGNIFATHLSIKSGLPPLNRHRILISEPRLSWEETCNLVVCAFEEFDPILGGKIRKRLHSSRRWQLTKTNPGEATGYCHPANCETNQNPYAVIEYHYDETINDVVYIAHELGHLISNDFINEAGFTYRDSKRHTIELPSFFTQYILYDYLSRHTDTELRHSGKNHFIGEITRDLYSIPIGIGALQAEKTAISEEGSEKDIRQAYEAVIKDWLGKHWHEYTKAKYLSEQINDPKARDRLGICNLHQHSMASIIAIGLFHRAREQSGRERSMTANMLFGQQGPKTINEILEAVGIRSNSDMQSLSKTSIENIIRPLANWQAKPKTEKALNTLNMVHDL